MRICSGCSKWCDDDMSTHVCRGHDPIVAAEEARGEEVPMNTTPKLTFSATWELSEWDQTSGHKYCPSENYLCPIMCMILNMTKVVQI